MCACARGRTSIQNLVPLGGNPPRSPNSPTLQQAPTAGMMPSSDSDEDEDEEAKAAKVKAKKKAAADGGGPSKEAAGAPKLTRKEEKAMAADMGRLALVRQRR